jgi:hypothetical protein
MGAREECDERDERDDFEDEEPAAGCVGSIGKSEEELPFLPPPTDCVGSTNPSALLTLLMEEAEEDEAGVYPEVIVKF